MLDDLNPQNNPATDEDIEIIPDTGDGGGIAKPQGELDSSNVPSEDLLLLLKDLGKIGSILADTYSETNQDTGEGFIQALDLLNGIEAKLNSDYKESLSVQDRDGFHELIIYLRGKLKRRVNNIGDNAMNL